LVVEFNKIDSLCAQARQTYCLIEKLHHQLQEKNFSPLFFDLEMPLIPVLAEMELSGIKVDANVLQEISHHLLKNLEELQNKIYEVAGEKFNISSPQQVGVILFEKLNLPKLKKIKTGYSTNVDVLEELSLQHSLPGMILEYRHFAKLLSTYVNALPTFISPETGRIHTIFHQTGTITGRFSSSHPNLQNIPIQSETGSQIRKAFVASSGNVLLTADYSQIELRVLAHFSQDAKLKEAFANNIDIHTSVAAEIFGVPYQEVTTNQRRGAKVVNFGIIYGQSPYGLSKELGISMKEAKKFIDAYFDHYQGVKNYMENLLQETREKKYVTTLLNKRRYIPDIQSPNHFTKKLAERMAVNTVMQGSAADIIKKAMVNIFQKKNKEALPFKILLQIHDELVLEVSEFVLAQVANLVKEEMLHSIVLSIPLEIKLSVGKNWLEVKPFSL
jgi:DNA polymerase-1